MTKNINSKDSHFSYQLRPMELNDASRVLAIEKSAHIAPWCRKIFNDCILVGYDCQVLEILENDKWLIVSFIISRKQGDACHLLNLCVAPDYQNIGYGYFMLNYLVNRLADTNYQYITLEVRPSNQKAIDLYTRFGFTQVEIKKAYYRDAKGEEDALVLKKSINQHT